MTNYTSQGHTYCTPNTEVKYPQPLNIFRGDIQLETTVGDMSCQLVWATIQRKYHMPRTEGQSENQLTPVCPETPLLVPVFLSPPRAFSMMCANASDGPYFYGSTSLVG